MNNILCFPSTIVLAVGYLLCLTAWGIKKGAQCLGDYLSARRT
jgi:hypothetical protein